MTPKAPDPLVTALERAIHAFLRVKRRYPILVATSKEMERLKKRSDVRPLSHDALIQIMRDSFDMLVIDLYSIRESLTAKRGLFSLLEAEPHRLWARPSTAAIPFVAHIATKNVGNAVKALTGSRRRATADTVRELCRRFRERTEPLDADRNRVRAHRYQQEKDTSRFFLGLPKLRRQIDFMSLYLRRMYLIVTHSDFSMELAFAGSGVAPDLADIIVHGSINAAVNYYRVVQPTKSNPTPWYWHARRKTLRSRPRRKKK
jgi:hypothetical protein